MPQVPPGSGRYLQIAYDRGLPLVTDEYDQKEFVRTGLQVHRDRVCISSAIEVDVLRFTVDFALFKSLHLHDRYLEHSILDRLTGVLHGDLQAVIPVGHLLERRGETPGSPGESGKDQYQKWHILPGHPAGIGSEDGLPGIA